jgi:hypothetical protein
VVLQPSVLVPATVKSVEVIGLAVTCDPVIEPGSQVYVAAPVAVRLTCEFAQNVDEGEEIVSVGDGNCETITVVVAWQPEEFSPVTE